MYKVYKRIYLYYLDKSSIIDENITTRTKKNTNEANKHKAVKLSM